MSSRSVMNFLFLVAAWLWFPATIAAEPPRKDCHLSLNSEELMSRSAEISDLCKTCRHLSVGFVGLRDDDVSALLTLTPLENLMLIAPEVTGSAFERLTGLPQLSALEYRARSVPTEIIDSLPKFQALTSLSFPEAHLSDKNLQAISEMTELRGLDIGASSELTSQGVSLLSTLRNLRALQLSPTLEPACLDGLSHLKYLERLSIPKQHIDEWLKRTVSFPLTFLSLGWTDLSDSGMKYVSRPSLDRLDGLWTKVTDSGVLILRCPNLKYADFSYTALSGKVLPFLVANSPNLTTLKLNGSKVRFFATLPPNKIERLDLWKTSIGNSDLQYIGKMDNLKSLDISGTKVGRKGISALSNLKKLTDLSIEGIPLDLSDVQTLSRLPKLEILILPNMSMKMLHPLLASKSLRRISIETATPSMIRKFRLAHIDVLLAEHH